jgi:histidine triad (HIT) family protein
MTDCIFCKIIQGTIPSTKIYEDDDAIAFHDINPAAPVHFLIVPKKHIDSLFAATLEDQQLLGKLMLLAPKLAQEQGCGGGFKTIINTGKDGGQEVYHLHIHVLGNKKI